MNEWIAIGPCRLWCGDCLEAMATMEAGTIDAIVTDPPYLTRATCVPVRGNGVAKRIEDTLSVGMPWGYSLDWIEACRRLNPSQWVVFCNYAMLGGVCSSLPPTTVFVWRKSNAPRMTRPVPRLDCEFIVWSRHGGCGRMGDFQSQVIDVPMPQAGCFAVERILANGSGAAAHPCQKPLAVVLPFVDRLPVQTVFDPYFGVGTTAVACIRTGRRFVGCEIEPKYFAIACERIADELKRHPLFPEPVDVARELWEE